MHKKNVIKRGLDPLSGKETTSTNIEVALHTIERLFKKKKTQPHGFLPILIKIIIIINVYMHIKFRGKFSPAFFHI